MVTTKNISSIFFTLHDKPVFEVVTASVHPQGKFLCIIESYRFHGAGHFLLVSLHSIGRCLLSEYRIAFLTSWCPCHCTMCEIPSKYWWCMHVCMLSHFSCVRLFATLWITACQAPLSMGFSSQEYWSGLPCPPPRALPDPGIKLASPAPRALQEDFLSIQPPGKPSLSLAA